MRRRNFVIFEDPCPSRCTLILRKIRIFLKRRKTRKNY